MTIQPRKTLFWRHQKFGDEYLATIEAIYYFMKDAFGGNDFDNLLYYFSFQYDLIQSKYIENRNSFTHRMLKLRPDYIKRTSSEREDYDDNDNKNMDGLKSLHSSNKKLHT